MRPVRERPWRELVAPDLRLDDMPVAEAGGLVPALLDTVHREKAAHLIASLPTSVITESAGLSYGLGTLLSRDDTEGAVSWFLRAHALVDVHDTLLLARIARDLGALHLALGEDEAARAVLSWTRGRLGSGSDHSADTLQLAALIADHSGDAASARLLNERSIEASAHALTPMTRVIGLSNLAAAGTHRDPRASIQLCRHALGIVTAERLHQRVEAPIRNVLGYALIPLGDLAVARRQLSLAAGLAAEYGHQRVALFTRFNLSIVAELEGDLPAARDALASLEVDAAQHGHRDTAQWASIRSCWIAYRINGRSSPDLSATAVLRGSSPPQQRAMRIISALAGAQRDGAVCANLIELATESLKADDKLEAFALQLQIAVRECAAGRARASRRWVRQAQILGVEGGFRCTPNWWEPALVDVARFDGSPRFSAALRRPLAPTSHPHVRILSDGGLEVDGRSVPEIWREGRTGSRVLRRLFNVLADTYPRALAREALCDLLWPESDGDRAVRNLYAATDDLRKALRSAPGIRLITDHADYSLELASWVSAPRDVRSARASAAAHQARSGPTSV